MEEEGELWTNLEKTAHFIFYLVYFNKDFYVAFTAKVQFFLSYFQRMQDKETACQGCSS